MKNYQKQRAENIFGAAVELDDPAERLSYVERACVGDEQLRREVKSLLEAAEEAGSFQTWHLT